MLFENLKMSWKNITQNKIRSFLTMLGIIIGVASIIALITIVQGATGSITSQISALGADRLTIQATGTPLKQGLNEQDFERLSRLDNVIGISPTVSGNVSISYNGSVKSRVSIQGKNHIFFQGTSAQLASGRGLNPLDVDGRSQVAVIGSNIVNDLFLGIDPIGKELVIRGNTYTIVGVLEPTSGFSMGSTNNAVVIPYTAAMKTLGVRNILNLEVIMEDATKSETIIRDIEGVLLAAFNYRENAFSIFNMQDMLDTIGNITGMMSLLLAGIASISLVVGGIGIMNMMLVSVTERTTEIGLRKALGAEPSRIQAQFLMESIFLSLFGGILGIIVGLGIALAAASLIGFSLTVKISTILLAAGFSATVGIIFGWMPARNASRLNPIDALRHV